MTRSQFIVSNIQVTVKAHGPLVCLLFCYVNFVMSIQSRYFQSYVLVFTPTQYFQNLQHDIRPKDSPFGRLLWKKKHLGIIVTRITTFFKGGLGP